LTFLGWDNDGDGGRIPCTLWHWPCRDHGNQQLHARLTPPS